MPCSPFKLNGKYLGDGRTPDGDHVARQPVEILADELQGLGPHDPVNQIYAVQQRWHGLGEGTKIVGQRLQTVQQLSFDAHGWQNRQQSNCYVVGQHKALMHSVLVLTGSCSISNCTMHKGMYAHKS